MGSRRGWVKLEVLDEQAIKSTRGSKEELIALCKEYYIFDVDEYFPKGK